MTRGTSCEPFFGRPRALSSGGDVSTLASSSLDLADTELSPDPRRLPPVSYTHLTLPTICSV
eukprot:219675-Rhodomonas_salina.2